MLIAVLFITPCLFVHAHAGAALGVKGGMNVSGWWGEDTEDEYMKAGFLGGLSFSYMHSDVFGIQAEILFHRKGVKDKFMSVDIVWNLDYLEIPMLLKCGYRPRNPYRWDLFSGPPWRSTSTPR